MSNTQHTHTQSLSALVSVPVAVLLFAHVGQAICPVPLCPCHRYTGHKDPCDPEKWAGLPKVAQPGWQASNPSPVSAKPSTFCAPHCDSRAHRGILRAGTWEPPTPSGSQDLCVCLSHTWACVDTHNVCLSVHLLFFFLFFFAIFFQAENKNISHGYSFESFPLRSAFLPPPPPCGSISRVSRKSKTNPEDQT